MYGRMIEMKTRVAEVGGFKIRLFFLKDLIVGVATDVGPRILYVAHKDRPEFNLFGVLPEVGGQTPEGFWRIYGGHRFWSSPESKPRTYSMDDKPVEVSATEETITIHGNPEVENSTQKKITIKASSSTSVEVVHSLTNIGRWPIKLGCWALSVMRKRGFAIVPLKPKKVDKEGLLPDRRVTFWPYTDLSDERLTYAKGYAFMRQNPEAANPCKIGAMANPAWAAYWVDGIAFVKQFTQEEGEYPDFGCSVEVYTNPDFLELETLGPLKTVNPSETIQHLEVWKILNVGELASTPESIEGRLEPLLSG